MHSGFAAWIYAFSKVESSQEKYAAPAVVLSKNEYSSIADIDCQMVMIISDMVLSTLQGVAL